MNTALELGREVGINAACEALNLNRASYYRAQQPRPEAVVERPRPPLALSVDEEQRVLVQLHSDLP